MPIVVETIINCFVLSATTLYFSLSKNIHRDGFRCSREGKTTGRDCFAYNPPLAGGHIRYLIIDVRFGKRGGKPEPIVAAIAKHATQVRINDGAFFDSGSFAEGARLEV